VARRAIRARRRSRCGALCEAAGDLLAGLCEHDDVDYVNASPAARWLMRRLIRRG